VIAHEPGAGRHKGRLGALAVQLPIGTRFSVGTGFSDAERSSPPAIGATITFRYQELSDAGVPRFPSYVSVRVAAPVAPSVDTPKEPKPAKTTVTVNKKESTMSKPRYFEYVEGTSSKFWEVSQSGNEMTTRWGRIGSTGQSKTKSFADEAAAAKQVEKLIAEKTREGYIEKTAE
jgi:DNA ligase-1